MDPSVAQIAESPHLNETDPCLEGDAREPAVPPVATSWRLKSLLKVWRNASWRLCLC